MLKKYIEQVFLAVVLAVIGCGIAAVLQGCGSGGGGGSTDTTPRVTQAEVVGRFEGAAPAKAAMALEPQGTTIINSTRSAIVNACIENHLGAFKQGELVTVMADVYNQGTEDIKNVRLEINIEDKNALTRETWTCYKRWLFHDGTGSRAGSVWILQGGDYFTALANAPSPLPACSDVHPNSASVTCDPVSWPETNCTTWDYYVEYTKPGNGLNPTITSGISLAAGKSSSFNVGFADSSMEIRDNTLATYTLKDSEGNVLSEKHYTFNVTAP